jgi:tetratricopeptide (TPR) repeat protein
MKGLRTLVDFLRFLFTSDRPPAGIEETPLEPPAAPEPEPPPAAPEPTVEEESLYATATESSVARQYEQAARTAFRQGRYEEAIALAEQSLRLDPGNLFAYHYLGSAYLELGRFDEGIAAFERAREQGDPLGLTEGWVQEAEQRRAAGPADTAAPPKEEPE